MDRGRAGSAWRAAIAGESVQVWRVGMGVGGFWLAAGRNKSVAETRNTVEPDRPEIQKCTAEQCTQYTFGGILSKCPYEMPMSGRSQLYRVDRAWQIWLATSSKHM